MTDTVPEREIRADYDDQTVVVYQAYRAEIALPTVAHNRFVPPFSRDRMTWIKPSFLWMMERSGWGRKPGQEHILAIRITRAGWEEALAQAVLTSFAPGVYRDFDDWQRQLAAAPVRVQWDPERTLTGASLRQRAIQVGLSRHIVARYVDVWTREIRDCTPLVHRIYEQRQAGETTKARALLPRERAYPLDAAIARRLGMG
ncbi:MAG TPA: DUF4291 domain-containing protein [Ktedonobacterales bacterium]|nr:DUF4291 domain-containing protein [Ktedonobacterales bacterium]